MISPIMVKGHKQAQDPPGSLHANISSVEWSSLKGRGPRWFTVRKTDLLYKDVTFWLTFNVFFFFLFFSSPFFVFFFIGNLLMSSSTQFLVVLFFIAFYTAPFSSKYFFLGLSVRSLSTQLFFLVVLLLLLLSVTAFSYVGILSLFFFSFFFLPRFSFWFCSF